MRIFLSYRRADSQYLATLVHDGLRQRMPSSTLFLDVDSIRPGQDFLQRLESALAHAHAVIALIGPGWHAERTRDPADHVRRELLIAQARSIRVVPVVHSGQTMPALPSLGPELAWLHDLDAFAMGSATTLGPDLDRLASVLYDRGPELEALRNEAWACYERGDIAGVLRVADETWQSHVSSPSAGLADICRTAAVALTRDGRLDERNLWLSRGLSMAFLSGAANALAASLLPLFFQTVAAGRHADAERILDEIERLTDTSDESQLPPSGTMRRLCAEKRAFLLYVQGEFDRATRSYEQVVSAPGIDPRGRLKARAALALCAYHLGERGRARDETSAVLTEADDQGFSDISVISRSNLAAMMRGDDRLTPYEVT